MLERVLWKRYLDNHAVSCQSVAEHYCMDGKQLQTQYKELLSDFNNWDQKEHAEDFILYPKNIGYHLCIDETALSKGELYTILTNRDKHGRKGAIVAIVKGTKAEDVISVLLKMDAGKRNQVKEIHLIWPAVCRK
ncbi:MULTISPECIES: hypothetical protein [Phocaeicola]|uniref:hypothetical protein n=1 Tax=Phocaeicola TaxID=909656 RepID=UPI00216B4BB4|nr:hypothetical protein [Phocaeicola vulgatus]